MGAFVILLSEFRMCCPFAKQKWQNDKMKQISICWTKWSSAFFDHSAHLPNKMTKWQKQTMWNLLSKSLDNLLLPFCLSKGKMTICRTNFVICWTICRAICWAICWVHFWAILFAGQNQKNPMNLLWFLLFICRANNNLLSKICRAKCICSANKFCSANFVPANWLGGGNR